MVASARVTIDWQPFDPSLARPRLLLVTNRFSHAAHAFEQLLDDGEIVAAARAFHATRVDCDERPDLDVPLQRRTGGPQPTWPLVAIYDAAGALTEVATHLNRRTLLELLKKPPGAPLPPAAEPPRATVDEALAAIKAAFDRQHGGFEAPPKRPRAPLLELLLAIDPVPALRTLDGLMQGGIHDQLGGGFHAYSTDERWVVPHFEKRAADQAALLIAFARAAASSSQPRYALVARRIIAYVECRLALEGGGYAASEDADVGAYDDASHYTWSVDEARQVLDADELAVVQPYFDLYGRGELHSDPTRNVLFVAASPEEVARELGLESDAVRHRMVLARDKLLAARSERPTPAVDLTPYAGVWSKMARAYLEAEAALGITQERERALYTLERLYALRTPDGGIPHRLDGVPSIGWLDDHVELGLAALRAFEATTDKLHLDAARAVADHLLEGWWHSDGGFTSQPGGDDRPFRDGADGPGPSANAVAGALLWGVSTHSGEPRYADRARALVEALLPLACGAGVDGAGLIYLRVVGGIGQ
ncbi:MAG: hypothetical protein JWN44_4278 [Myxococcales bacterium]|nr:hypothetical protein [Myxococcales bacterium]